MIIDPSGTDPLSASDLNLGAGGQFPLGSAEPAAGQSAGHLGICDFGAQAIQEARNPSITFVQMTQIRARLACPGCVQAFDLEVKLKTTLASAVVEPPPAGLQTRISAALESMDLSQLDVTDF